MILVCDGDCIGIEGDVAAGVAQLADGEEGVGCQVGDDVDLASGRREMRNIQLGGMGRIHDRAVGVVDGDRIGGKLFVDNWERCGAEMGGATSVGNDGAGGGTVSSI